MRTKLAKTTKPSLAEIFEIFANFEVFAMNS
jgi:hypothetical protein